MKNDFLPIKDILTGKIRYIYTPEPLPICGWEEMRETGLEDTVMLFEAAVESLEVEESRERETVSERAFK